MASEGDITDLERIQSQVDENPIVIYMKGTPQSPQCGFSRAAVSHLAETGVEFAYVNVMEDEGVYYNLPAFADWPTFPQIYFNGELVGGGDIITTMAEDNSLKDLMEHAVQTHTGGVPQ